MTFKLTIISIILAFLGNISNADNFSYDYIDIKIGTTNSDAQEKEVYLGASKSLNDNFSLRGGLYYQYGDWTKLGKYREQVGTGLYFDIVFNKEITSNTDLIISSGYSYFNAKAICTPTTGACSASTNATYQIDIFTATLGLKQKLSDSIDIEALYRFIDVEGSTTNVDQGNLILTKQISNNNSVGIDYSWNTTGADFNRTGIFLRRDF